MMTAIQPAAGAIDCDVHPSVPSIQALVPYLDPYWQEMVELRGISGFGSQSVPPKPFSVRAGWRGEEGRAAIAVGDVQRQLFDPWGPGRRS